MASTQSQPTVLRGTHVLIGMLLFFGAIFALVDILMIFREGNRCLHDDIAGTMVVQA